MNIYIYLYIFTKNVSQLVTKKTKTFIKRKKKRKPV